MSKEHEDHEQRSRELLRKHQLMLQELQPKHRKISSCIGCCNKFWPTCLGHCEARRNKLFSPAERISRISKQKKQNCKMMRDDAKFHGFLAQVLGIKRTATADEISQAFKVHKTLTHKCEYASVQKLQPIQEHIANVLHWG